MKNTVDLYREINNGVIDRREIKTILPDVVKKDLQRDVMHFFTRPSGYEIFRPDEVLYLAEHAAVYQEKDDAFDTLYGAVYLGGERIVFINDDRQTSLTYADMVWVTKYDDEPQIVEIQSDEATWMVRIPDAESLYRCLQLIRNKEYTKVIKEPSLSYGDMIEKAGPDAFAFAFKYTLSGGLRDDIGNVIRDIAESTESLLEVLHKHPEQLDEATRFLSDHIPAAIRILLSYRESVNEGPGDDELRRLHERVLDAETALRDALREKTAEIRKECADGTVAGADALRTGLEQDGLKPGEIRLVF